MLIPLKSSATPPVGRRLAMTDSRLSAAMDQLAARLGTRPNEPKVSAGEEPPVRLTQFRAIDESWRRLSENLYSAQETLQTLENVDDVLGELSALAGRAMRSEIDDLERTALQERIDILRPRFAALDNLNVLTPEGAAAAARSIDRAYEAMEEFRRQVDSILVALESAAENMRLAAAAWSPEVAPERAGDSARLISAVIRLQPEDAITTQARTGTASALVLLKP